MSSKVWHWLSNHLMGSQQEAKAPATPPAPTAGELLDALTGEVKALELKISRVDLDDPEAVARLRDARAKEQHAALEEKIKTNHLNMREDILKACADLKVGVDSARLDALADKMDHYTQELAPLVQESGARGDMLRAVLTRIFQETGTMAWDRLEELMREAGRQWPEPEGLPPSMPAAELKERLDKEHEAVEHDFIYGKLRLALLRGSVPVWQAAYPDRGTPLWDKTALRGVATVLRARLLGQVLDEMVRREDEIRKMVVGLVEGPLQHIHEALTRGVSSLAEATSLLEEAQDICRKQATEQIWAMVSPVAHV